MAVIDLMVERVWPIAKRIVLSWNDQASEIFILDLPLQDMARILDVISAATTDPVVLRFDGINLEKERPLTQQMRNRLIERSRMSTVHSLRASIAKRANCYFYFWIDAERGCLETEMVFWNDLSFPAGVPLTEHKSMLGRLLRIAHGIRGENHQCKCILSPEYNSEPRELLNGALNGESKEVAIW